MYGGLVQLLLFDLGKLSLWDSGDTDPRDSSPKINLPFYQPKKIKPDSTPHQHPYDTRSKTQTSTILQLSNINEDSYQKTEFGTPVSSLLGPWV